MGGQHHAPAALPPGRTRYPLYRRLEGLRSGLDGGGKNSPPPGFDPRTIQPVASSYTDRAIAAHLNILHVYEISNFLRNVADDVWRLATSHPARRQGPLCVSKVHTRRWRKPMFVLRCVTVSFHQCFSMQAMLLNCALVPFAHKETFAFRMP